MKVKEIKKTINENVGRMMIDEESFFEGHNFITYGKQIELVSSDSEQGQVDKDSVVVKWIAKFDIGNIGVFGVNIDVKSITAEIGDDEDEEIERAPLNLNGFEHVITKRKNPEVQELQVFLSSVHINTAEHKIEYEFTI